MLSDAVAQASAQPDAMLADAPAWAAQLLVAFLVSVATAGLLAHASREDGPPGIPLPRAPAAWASRDVSLSRLGGFALSVAFSFAMFVEALGDDGLTALWFALCVLPVLSLAAAEDVGLSVGLAYQSLGILVTATIYISMPDTAFVTGRPEGSLLLALMPILSFLLYVLIVTATTQAMSLIDGLQGLCAGVALLIFLAFAWIAYEARQETLLRAALIFATVTLGFLLLNYPYGLVQLGRTGGYWLGFAAAALALLLLGRADGLSPAAVLLVVFWPAFDLALTLARRLRGAVPPLGADTMHAHQVGARLLKARAQGRAHRSLSDPLASAIIWGLAAFPLALGTVFWNHGAAAWAALVVIGALYAGLYHWLVARGRRARWPWRPGRSHG